MKLLKQLAKIVGKENSADDLEDGVLRSYDATKQRALPDVVVKPGSREEVSEILKVASETETPIYPRGAGSGLSGGAVPLKGGVVMDFARMRQIIEIDPSNSRAIVEPGVLTGDFQREVEKHGLFYPPDPASADFSTIGGNLAENAGGLRGFKYGVTRDYVLAAEVVLADGSIIHTGAKTLKSVTGYDLTSLFVGSEGTLCVFTEATLRLIPLPESVRTVLAYFDDVTDALRAAAAIMRSPIPPRATEFLDEASIECVRDYGGFSIPDRAKSFLLIDVDGPYETAAREQAKVEEICQASNAYETIRGVTPEERERLWAPRRAISPAVYLKGAVKINEDLCVPPNKTGDILRKIHAVSEKYEIPIINFGHIADGNIHTNLMVDDTPDDLKNAHRAVAEIFGEVVKLGGTLSGEHGIGNRKSEVIEIEIPPRELRLMRDIKMLLDPKGILNPGKMYPAVGADG